MKLKEIRDWLMPQGSLRHRAFSILANDGVSALFIRSGKLAYVKIQQFLLLKLWKPGRQHHIFQLPELLPQVAGKADIFCFSIIPWEYRYQRPQHLLTQFADDGHRIFYLHTKFGGFGSSSFSFRMISKRISELTLPGDASLTVYRDDLTDPSLSISFHALCEFISRAYLSRVICLVQHPFWIPLASLVKKQYGWKTVYDCMDDISGFEFTHGKMVVREEELISQSDLVVATSQVLYQRLRKKHPNCVLIPNAADYEHFSQLPDRETSPLAGLPRPVIGYYGAISGWFDVEAVRQAALKHPEWSLVLIGDTWGGNPRKLGGLANIYLLGEKPYEELPLYLSGFDICTIPFIRNALTEATNPVKLFEYLSAGKPIVATSLPELQPFQDLVLLYRSLDEFVAQIEYALMIESHELIEKRRAVARENTWSKRYQALKPYLDRFQEEEK